MHVHIFVKASVKMLLENKIIPCPTCNLIIVSFPLPTYDDHSFLKGGNLNVT